MFNRNTRQNEQEIKIKEKKNIKYLDKRNRVGSGPVFSVLLKVLYYRYSTKNILKIPENPYRNLWLIEFSPSVNSGNADIAFLIRVKLPFCAP